MMMVGGMMGINVWIQVLDISIFPVLVGCKGCWISCLLASGTE